MPNKICKNQHECLIKYVKNKISNSTFHKKREENKKNRGRGAKTTQLQKHHF